MSALRVVIHAVSCAAVLVLTNPAQAQPDSAPPQPSTSSERDGGFNLGAGFGIPYGGLVGGEAEVVPIVPVGAEKLGRYASFSVGVGGVPSGIGFDFGANLYPRGRAARLQPKLLFRYGVVGNIQYESGWERIMGLSLGAGLRRQLSPTLGVEADVLYVAKVFGSFSDDDPGSRFKVAAGLRWNPSQRAGSGNALSRAAGAKPADAELGVGLGVGIPFGGIGADFEFSPRIPGMPSEVYEHTALSLGVGITAVGPGYSLGVRGYPLGKAGPIVPRVAAYYGVVAMAEYSDGSSERIEGFALGAAFLRRLGERVSVEAETLYIFPDWGGSRLDSHLKISVGLHARLR